MVRLRGDRKCVQLILYKPKVMVSAPIQAATPEHVGHHFYGKKGRAMAGVKEIENSSARMGLVGLGDIRATELSGI
jgi:hypothetical protein